MRQVLHILTRPSDDLANEVITRQQQDPELRVAVVDLSGEEPDYAALLEAIFAADSIASW